MQNQLQGGILLIFEPASRSLISSWLSSVELNNRIFLLQLFLNDKQQFLDSNQFAMVIQVALIQSGEYF